MKSRDNSKPKKKKEGVMVGMKVVERRKGRTEEETKEKSRKGVERSRCWLPPLYLGEGE